MTFKAQIEQGIPTILPSKKKYDTSLNHAPKRKEILSPEEKKLALKNALRYFDVKHHSELLPEFAEELEKYGRIYMYRFKPDYKMYARDIAEYPGKSEQAKAIMLMIQNNLDNAVAQHPEELITYGGNGAVFQNWAQYLLTMKYLSEMTDKQTLTMFSGHPMGLFPSNKNAPRVVVTNGMTIPNYSKPDDWEKMNALGVSQYGQMTAGSYMYIGPQGIVHGTTITVLNGFRKINKEPKGNLFVTSGLGGMSGAQPKAGNIAGCVTVCAEVNPKIAKVRLEQGWIDEKINNLDDLVARVKSAKENKETVSIAYLGNIVDVWEKFDENNIHIDLGSDQTSLHNPWAGGYYPVDISFEDANNMLMRMIAPPPPPPSDTELTNGNAVTGLAGAAGSELNYFMNVPAGASNLSFNMSGGSGDADLYVRHGAKSTTSAYDCRPYKNGNNEVCTFSAPAAGTWYIDVRGYSAASGVSINVTANP